MEIACGGIASACGRVVISALVDGDSVGLLAEGSTGAVRIAIDPAAAAVLAHSLLTAVRRLDDAKQAAAREWSSIIAAND